MGTTMINGDKREDKVLEKPCQVFFQDIASTVLIGRHSQSFLHSAQIIWLTHQQLICH